MEALAAMLILIPILVPVAVQLGIDPLHFGLVFVLNLMIGTITPPVGIVLFVTAKVANISFDAMARAILPWIMPLLAVLVAITLWPPLTTWLPGIVMARWLLAAVDFLACLEGAHRDEQQRGRKEYLGRFREPRQHRDMACVFAPDQARILGVAQQRAHMRPRDAEAVRERRDRERHRAARRHRVVALAGEQDAEQHHQAGVAIEEQLHVGRASRSGGSRRGNDPPSTRT